MNMDKRIIGEKAGIIWRTLHNNKMSWEELLKNTGLKPLELASGIGWLAREDKISIYPRKPFPLLHHFSYIQRIPVII